MSLRRKARTLCARLSHGTGAIVSTAALAAILACSTQAQVETIGKWDPPVGGYDWPLVNAEHAVHLSTGKILVWQDGDNAKLWDPGNGGFTSVPNNDHNVGCSGLTALAKGSILAAGGGGEDGPTGTDKTSVFRLGPVPPSGPWQEVDPMFWIRWYPTCTTLPDGKVLAIGGTDKNVGQPDHVYIPQPEVYDPDTQLWDDPLACQPPETWQIYPRMFLLPDGTVFFAGPGVSTRTLNVSTGSWTFIDNSNFEGGGGSSAVTYEPGVVLKCGGGGNSGDRTDVIDLNQPTPAWVEGDLMEQSRHRHNLVLLPDGKILAIGGRQWDEVEMEWVPVLPAEWFDPDPLDPHWQALAAMTRPRSRHSTAVLLPDGTVLACGGNPDFEGHPTSQSGEIFSPPYLFKAGGGDAPRPMIGFAPTVVTYGSDFSVILSGQSVPVEEIDKVSFLRLGAVTHSFDQNQRYVPLQFEVDTGPIITPGLIVKAPADGNLAPPGYYMLFLISDAGVPSVAKYVRLQ